MAGNSSRRGAAHRGPSKAAGSGGRNRKGLQGRGPTPKAEDRPYHVAYKAKQRAEARGGRQGGSARARKGGGRTAGAEWVVGRNPVLEALTAGLPVKTAYVAEGAERDDRLRDILKFAADHSLTLMQVTRAQLDQMTGGAIHQGVALQLPGFEYAELGDVIDDALSDATTEPLLVALDGITDPHNLGAIIRSAAAFGAHGVVIPERRSASMTASAWKASAGAAARIPVARVGNLNRALEDCAKAGFTVVGLAGEGTADIGGVPGVDGPVVLVIGSEGVGLARLVREHCDVLAAIPISSSIESLNASVAASIALYEVHRSRAMM